MVKKVDEALSVGTKAVAANVYVPDFKQVDPFHQVRSGPVPHRMWPECSDKIIPQ